MAEGGLFDLGQSPSDAQVIKEASRAEDFCSGHKAGTMNDVMRMYF